MFLKKMTLITMYHDPRYDQYFRRYNPFLTAAGLGNLQKINIFVFLR